MKVLPEIRNEDSTLLPLVPYLDGLTQASTVKAALGFKSGV
jgi:hypothetical protein